MYVLLAPTSRLYELFVTRPRASPCLPGRRPAALDTRPAAVVNVTGLTVPVTGSQSSTARPARRRMRLPSTPAGVDEVVVDRGVRHFRRATPDAVIGASWL